MQSKDVRRSFSFRPSLRFLASVGGCIAIVGVCAGLKMYWGAEIATAQAPVTRTPVRTTRPAPAAPGAARTTTPAGAPAATEKKLKIVAVVNGQSISRDELARECLTRYGKDVLEGMVNRYLIHHACQRYNIQVTNDEVDQEVERLAKKLSLPVDRWLKLLSEKRDVSPEVYKRDIIWPTLALRRLAANEIKITPEEIQKVRESELGPRVYVRMIVTRDPNKAKQLHAMVQAKPDDFATIAKDHSEDRNSASGYGIIPPVRRHVGDPAIEKACFALKEGEISPVVSAIDQYFIFRCDRHEAATIVRPEHNADVTQRITDHLEEKKMREASPAIFRRLQDETKVVNVMNDKVLSQQYPGVAARVGAGQITIREVAEECLSRHGKEVLGGEIHRKILTQALIRAKATVQEQDIDREIQRAAMNFGYETPAGKPDIQAWLKHVTEPKGATVELYVRDAVWPTVALKKLTQANVTVSQEDLDKGYDANFGPRVNVLAIVCRSHRECMAVWEKARTNPSPKFFGELAAQYSIEPVSKANNGQVPPIRRHGGQPQIEQIAFSLRPGELSGVIVQGDSYIVLKCLGYTKPVVTDRKAVEPELRDEIHEKKLRIAMAKKFDELKQAAQIDNFLAGTSQTPRQSSASRTPVRQRVPFATQPRR